MPGTVSDGMRGGQELLQENVHVEGDCNVSVWLSLASDSSNYMDFCFCLRHYS